MGCGAPGRTGSWVKCTQQAFGVEGPPNNSLHFWIHSGLTLRFKVPARPPKLGFRGQQGPFSASALAQEVLSPGSGVENADNSDCPPGLGTPPPPPPPSHQPLSSCRGQVFSAHLLVQKAQTSISLGPESLWNLGFRGEDWGSGWGQGQESVSPWSIPTTDGATEPWCQVSHSPLPPHTTLL